MALNEKLFVVLSVAIDREKEASVMRLVASVVVIAVTESAQIPLVHEILAHATIQVLLGLLAAFGVLILLAGYAQHVLEHFALALVVVVERERALHRRLRLKDFLSNIQRGHRTLLKFI